MAKKKEVVEEVPVAAGEPMFEVALDSDFVVYINGQRKFISGGRTVVAKDVYELLKNAGKI